MTWLLLGLAAGAVVAVLYAPCSGQETREKLCSWWDAAREKLGLEPCEGDEDSEEEA